MAQNFVNKNVSIRFGNVFTEGQNIQFEMEADAVTREVGNDGEVTFIVTANRAGNVTMTLMGTSAINDLMSNLYHAQERSGVGYPLLIKDGRGTTIIQANQAMIKKLPSLQYQDSGPGEREWELLCDTMAAHIGGNEL